MDTKRSRPNGPSLSYLLDIYKLNNNPSVNERKQIASHTSMSDKAIRIWFQNRRAKMKKESLKSYYILFINKLLIGSFIRLLNDSTPNLKKNLLNLSPHSITSFMLNDLSVILSLKNNELNYFFKQDGVVFRMFFEITQVVNIEGVIEGTENENLLKHSGDSGNSVKSSVGNSGNSSVHGSNFPDINGSLGCFLTTEVKQGDLGVNGGFSKSYGGLNDDLINSGTNFSNFGNNGSNSTSGVSNDLGLNSRGGISSVSGDFVNERVDAVGLNEEFLNLNGEQGLNGGLAVDLNSDLVNDDLNSHSRRFSHENFNKPHSQGYSRQSSHSRSNSAYSRGNDGSMNGESFPHEDLRNSHSRPHSRRLSNDNLHNHSNGDSDDSHLYSLKLTLRSSPKFSVYFGTSNQWSLCDDFSENLQVSQPNNPHILTGLKSSLQYLHSYILQNGGMKRNRENNNIKTRNHGNEVNGDGSNNFPSRQQLVSPHISSGFTNYHDDITLLGLKRMNDSISPSIPNEINRDDGLNGESIGSLNKNLIPEHLLDPNENVFKKSRGLNMRNSISKDSNRSSLSDGSIYKNSHSSSELIDNYNNNMDFKDNLNFLNSPNKGDYNNHEFDNPNIEFNNPTEFENSNTEFKETYLSNDYDTFNEKHLNDHFLQNSDKDFNQSPKYHHELDTINNIDQIHFRQSPDVASSYRQSPEIDTPKVTLPNTPGVFNSEIIGDFQFKPENNTQTNHSIHYKGEQDKFIFDNPNTPEFLTEPDLSKGQTSIRRGLYDEVKGLNQMDSFIDFGSNY